LWLAAERKQEKNASVKLSVMNLKV
jgi:hypothetical protein